MIKLSSFYKRKIVVASIVLVLTLVAVLYPAQARETTVSLGHVSTHTSATEAAGFSWEIYVYPTQGQIVAAKYMWLIDANGEEIAGTRYAYNIDCVKRGVNLEKGRDVYVEGNVIKFTGAFLRCDEDVPADFADFRSRVSNWDIAICEGDICEIQSTSLFIEAYVKPYEQERPGMILKYPLFDNRDFLFGVNQNEFGWIMPATDQHGISLASPIFNQYSWGNQIKRLYMEKQCNSSGKPNSNEIITDPCTIHYSINHGPFEEQQGHGYPTSYTYGIESNRFYVGLGGGEFGRFYGELQQLRFDPNSCPGCIPPPT